VEDLKASSGASRIFVAVDYLQVWPVPDTVAKHIRTDIDADKWRIGQMKELRDAQPDARKSAAAVGLLLRHAPLPAMPRTLGCLFVKRRGDCPVIGR
jgi:hypothetical protein